MPVNNKLEQKQLKIDAIDHLVVNVRDVERSAEWFEQVLGHAATGLRAIRRPPTRPDGVRRPAD